MAVRKEWAAMPALITDEMVDTFAITGTWEEIGPAIEAAMAICCNGRRSTSPSSPAKTMTAGVACWPPSKPI